MTTPAAEAASGRGAWATSVSGRLRQGFASEDGFDRGLLAPLISGAVLDPINSTRPRTPQACTTWRCC